MKKFANSNMVNYGIALALFGILVFSLMSSVEGMAEGNAKNAPAKTNKAKINEMQKAVATAVKKMTPEKEKMSSKKTSN